MSETSDERARRIIADCEWDIITIDGELCFYPDGLFSMSANDLRVIADELDRRNAANKESKQ